MAQSSSENKSCIGTKRQCNTEVFYACEILLIGWVAGCFITYSSVSILTSPAFAVQALQFIFIPYLWLLLFCYAYTQYMFVRVFNKEHSSYYQKMKSACLGGFVLAFACFTLYFIEHGIIVLTSRSFDHTSYFLCSDYAILVLGLFLGTMMFLLLKYPNALMLYGFSIIVLSYRTLVIITMGAPYDTFIDSDLFTFIAIYILFVKISFGLGLILIGIRGRILLLNNWRKPHA